MAKKDKTGKNPYLNILLIQVHYSFQNLFN